MNLAPSTEFRPHDLAKDRAAFGLRVSLVLLVAASGAYYSSPPFADNDLWGHLYFGGEILKNGRVPTINQYSFTAPNHPWINHEILAEWLFALVFARLGSPGLLALKFLVGLTTLGFLARAAIRRSPYPLARAAALVMCAALMHWGFLVRPQIFTFLALAIVWERLGRYDENRTWRSLLVLPVVFSVWVNTHGGVAAGVAVLLFYVLVQSRSLDRSQWLPLVALATASVLALLVNPYGIGLPVFLVRDLLRSRQITEWEPIPPIGEPTPFAPVVLLYGFVLVLVALGIFMNRRKRPWEILTIGIVAVAAFRHQRHLPLFAIVAAPFLAESIGNVGDALRRGLRVGRLSAPANALLALGVLAVALLQFTDLVSTYNRLHGQIFVSPQQFPVNAVHFIKQNQLHGNLTVPFDWGEYAIWHLYPRCRVSVDGRYTTAYPDDVLEQSFRFLSGAPGWRRSVDEGDVVLLQRRQPIVRAMFDDADWQYVYSDDIALVFMRKTEMMPTEWDRRPLTTAEPFSFP